MTSTVVPVVLPPGDSTSIKFIPYLESDVTAIVDIVKASSQSSTVVAALVLNDQVNTNESFERSQVLLKEVLQKELVEKISGAIRPTLSRYQNLVFFMEDGALYIDEDELPIFRPGKEDGSIPSLGARISEELLQSSKEEVKATDTSLSIQLLNKVIGYGTEKEIKALCNLALLAKNVNANHDSRKEAIIEEFLRAAEGTTNEQLLKRKAELEDRLATLEKKVKDEVDDIQSKESDLKDLENNFRDLLSSVNLEDELFDVDSFLQDNTDFSVILKAFVDRFEHLKDKEKAENESTANSDSYKEQRLKFEAMLKTKKADRAKIQTEIDQLIKDIERFEGEKAKAVASKKAAEDLKREEEGNEQVFANRKKKLNGLMKNELETIATNVPVKYTELSAIEREVKTGTGQENPVSKLREASKQLNSANETLNKCKNVTSARNETLTNARNHETNKKREWEQKKRDETNAKNRFNSTSAKVGSGKDERDNPAYAQNRMLWQISITNTATAKTAYDSAVAARKKANTNYNTAVTEENTANGRKKTASNTKETAVREVQSCLSTLRDQANTSMQDAKGKIVDAETNITLFSNTVTARAQDIVDKTKDLTDAKGALKDEDDLIALLENKVKDIMDKEEAATNKKLVIDVKEGDRFHYHPWSSAGAYCVATYTDGVLKLYLESKGKDTDVCSWKCMDAKDTGKLVHGTEITVLWDGKHEHEMKAIDNNTFVVRHDGVNYQFTRIPPIIDVKEGDRFNYGPWSGACVATYNNGALRLYLESKGKDTVYCSWECMHAEDTGKLVYGGEITILWDGQKGSQKMKAIDNNTFTMNGSYRFTRIQSAIPPIDGGESDNESTNKELKVILEQRKRIKEDLEAHSKQKISLEREIAEIAEVVQDLEKEITASPCERLEKREVAGEARDKAFSDSAKKSAAQIEALVVSAGYQMLGAWGGQIDGGEEEDSEIALLRALVADIKGLSRPTKIRISQPTESFEQLAGANIGSCDIETVENIVKKLRAKFQHGDVDEVEYCVRKEFEEDLNVLPPESVVINSFTNSEAVDKNVILNPPKTTSQRLLYRQKPLYDNASTAASAEWVLLRTASSEYRNPLEHVVEKLVTMGKSEWALESGAKYLLTSWLSSKSITLSSIEELSTLVNKLEDMASNPDLAVSEFHIFHEMPEKGNCLVEGLDDENTSLRVTAGIVTRLLSLREAVVEAERNIVSSTETTIVEMAMKVRRAFITFSNEVCEKAVYIVKLEIERRKRSILTGDYDNLGGSNVEYASSLDELIQRQNEELEDALKEKEKLGEELKKIDANIKRNLDEWLEYKVTLEAEIAQLENDIRDKDEEMKKALADQKATEEEILKQLEDSDKLREELEVLKDQKEMVEEKAERAKTDAEKARQDVIKAEGELNSLRTKKEIVQENLNNAMKKKEDHDKWTRFMAGLAEELTDTETGIINRPELAKGYKNIQNSGTHNDMFTWISENFFQLKQQADEYADTASLTQKLDLRKALDQHLVDFPRVDPDVSGSGIMTVQGISLSYREIESALENFVTDRCGKFGLCFNRDGNLAVEQGRDIPSINDLPPQLQAVIRDRIQRYIEPDKVSDAGKPSWEKVEKEKVYDQFEEMLMHFERGVKKWDVLREYAKTIEVIVAKTLVIDKKVALPGFNFFVTAGKNIRLQNKQSIETSPTETIEFRNEKAKDGDRYVSDDGKSKGHNGDNGLYGKAGMNAGHVTLSASGTLSWNGQLTINAVGSKGANGQTGGDGEDGKKGTDGPVVDAEGIISGWGGCQAVYAWSRPPGIDSSGKPKIEEQSGPGGDGGLSGLGGQGGSGGQIVLRDSKSYFQQNQSQSKFGALELNISSKDGEDGEEGGYGNGGKGGYPGTQRPDWVFNKRSFFVKTKKKSGIIKEENYTDGLSTGFLGLGRWGFTHKGSHYKNNNRKYHEWGSSEYTGRALSKKDFDARKPFGATRERDGGLRATGKKGKNGKERMNSTARKEREMREENINISLEQEYQSQQYTAVESLSYDDAFEQASKTYAAESEKMQQEIEGLQQQMEMTEQQIQSSEMNLGKLEERSDRLAEEQEKLDQELDAIKTASNALQSELTQTDKEIFSKMLASLEQTEEIQALSLELSNLKTDSKYQGQLSNKLQAAMSTLETRAILQQAEIRQRQEMLDKKIAALTAEIMRTEQMKGELANVNIVSELDALLARAQTLSNDWTMAQQQQQQQTVQVEVDDDDDFDDSIVGATILLSVRDTFVRGSSPRSVWPDLASSPKAEEAVNAIISSVSSIPEEKRALTLELLEVLTRYSVFNKRFEILEGMLPLEDQEKAHEIVLETFQEVKEELVIDHWFIGSIAGVSILISSLNKITVDEASLTCRYDGIEALTASQTLTKNERSAVRFVRNLETHGHSFQELAQYLKQYTDAVSNAISLQGNGFLAVLQGKPVKFIDKFTRMILTALERDDHELAMHNIEIAIGMANTIRNTIEGLNLIVLHNSLLRKRDMRGGGGFTRLFLDNAKAAQDLLDANKREEALAQLCSKRQEEDQTTIYGPKNTDALIEEISKVEGATNSEVVSNSLLGVARALSGGVAVESREELDMILSRIKEIQFQTDTSGEDMKEAAEGPLKVISTVCLDLIGKMYSKDDDSIASIIQNAGVSRLNVISLPATDSIKRVLAFFRQIESISKDAAIFQKFLVYLKHIPLSYPAFSTKSKVFLDTLYPTPQEYEVAVEDVARNLAFEWLDFTEDVAQNSSNLVQRVITARDAGPIMDNLLPLASQILSIKAVKDIEAHVAEQVSQTTLKEIRDGADRAFEQFLDREKAKEEVDRIVSTCIFNLSADQLHSLWRFLCEESSPAQEDIGLLFLAIIQGSDSGSMTGHAHSQLHGASFLWSNWPSTTPQNFEGLSVLHDTSMAVAKVVFTRVLSSLSQYPTAATSYLRELVEGTLDVIGQYLEPRPTDKTSRDLYANLLKIVLALNTMSSIILKEKKEAERTKALSEKESEHLLLDKNLTKWILKLYSEIFQSDFDAMKISEVVEAFSSVDHTTEAENVEPTLRGILKGVLETEGVDFKHLFARCVYITIVSWSEQKHVPLIDSSEATDVAKVLFKMWSNDPSRNDFCTAGLAIFQSLVLQIRESEYDSRNNAYTCNDASQTALVDAASASLPKATASTSLEESPALLSENGRRVQFWKVCLSQINDELLHDSRIGNGGWATINSELSALKYNCDSFENGLIQKVNRTIYKRRKEQRSPQGTPKLLTEFKDEWTKKNWEQIQTLLRLIQYEDDPNVPPSTFIFNTQLEVLLVVMAEFMSNLKEIESPKHADAMGWLLDNLSDAYCGMYIVPDDELEGKLSRMISELSSFSVDQSADADLSTAAKNLVATLELMNPRLSRYTKVKRIMEDNFERSELKCILTSIDKKCEGAVELVSKMLDTSTVVGARITTMLYNFIDTLRAEKKFGSIVEEYEKRIDDMFDQVQNADTISIKEEAIKWFLSLDKVSVNKNQITYKDITKVSKYMSVDNAYEQELVQGAYRALFEQLGARLHYVLGMARESNFNLARNAIDQQDATKQEYYRAAQMGSGRAYNNMLCNSFHEARQQRMTFEDARASVLPAFQRLAESDGKAKTNLALLENDKIPTDRYSVKSPATEVTTSNSDFRVLKSEVHTLVSLLEQVLSACSRGTDTHTLSILVGEGVDQLYESLGADEPALVELTEHIQKFISDTFSRIEASPQLAPTLNDILASFYIGGNLDSVKEWCEFVLLLPDVSEISRVLFPEKERTILYASMAMNNDDGVNFVIRLLPKVVSERIALLQRDMVQEDVVCQTAILQRLGQAGTAYLTAYRGRSADEGAEYLQKAQKLIDYVMFESWINLQEILDGGTFEMLLSLQEQNLAKILSNGPKSSYFISHVTHDDVSMKFISPALWEDRLGDLVLSHLLEKFNKQDIEKNLAALKETFWSPSIPRDEQMPLARADKELEKVESALGLIFPSRNVGNLTYCNQQYQHIFDATHYILYLTTADYITSVRCPDPDQETQLQMRKDEELYEEWKAKREKVALESREMVKSIKSATETLIDSIGISKKVHERLLAMESIFLHDAPEIYADVDKLLDSPRSSDLTIEFLLWLLQTSSSSAAVSFLQNELGNHDVMTLEAKVFSVAFSLIELNVSTLTTAMNSDTRESAMSRVLALMQQQLPAEGGIQLLKLLVKTTNKMVYDENKPEVSKASARNEEVEALVECLKLLVEINAWHQESLLFKLEAYSIPSRWLAVLRQQNVAMALSYNPDTTSKTDKEYFMKAASAIDRIRQRRGSLVAELFLQCLQLLVKSNADALTLSTIASKVSSNRWDFSAADKADYEVAAEKETGSEMLEYLESKAEKKREVESLRSIKDLTDIMTEEVTGVNKSISHFLRKKENESYTELEWRVQCIDKKMKAVDESGKSIEDWEKDDVIAWSKRFKKKSNLYFTEDHTDKLNEMIAVFKHVAYLIKGEDLRNPQLLTIILFIDGMVRDKGLLGEIGTGEGKTVITILSTAARVFKGETVDVLSSSRVLAERDSIEAKEWFDYFDMSVSCNCDDEAEADPSVRQKRYHENSIVYGEAGAFQRDLLLTEFYGKDIRKKVADSIVIDEVDSLLIDEMANTLYISHEIQDLTLLNEIFVSIWLAVNGADASNYSEGNVARVKQYINQQIYEGKLAVPSWLKAFGDRRLETWIRNAYKAKSMVEGDQYILLQSGLKRGQVTVVNLYTGIEMHNTKWSNGLHQFVSLKHNNKLTAESLKAIFLANVNYVKKYGWKIIGMTGTLGADAELRLLKNVYSVNAFRMPRFMSERFFEDSAIVVGSQARWIELVADHVVKEQSNTEGFDISELDEEVQHQQDKLKKAEKKLKKNRDDVIKRSGRINEITAIRNQLSKLSGLYLTPSDLESRAVKNIESLIGDIEMSHFITEESSELAKTTYVFPLKKSVADLKCHIQEVTSQTEASVKLSGVIKDKESDYKELIFKDPSAIIEIREKKEDLESTRTAKAELDDTIESLKGQTNTKQDNVLKSLTAMQQGLSRPIEEYIQTVEAKKRNDEKKVKEYIEEVEDRNVKLSAAKIALESGTGGRAVLVICRNTNDADAVAATLVARKTLKKLYHYTGTNDSITELNPMTGAVIRTKVPLVRLSPHDVMVATNIAGRGTSLKTTKVVEQCGGLHVLLAYVPSNIRVEMQAWGRTSRHGHNGSGKFIVCDPRVSTSQEVIDIDYLLSERDLLESDRLEKVEIETIPRVNIEKELFDKFSAFSDEISAQYSEKISSELQQKELRDQWAFFLEEQDEELEQYFKNPRQAEQHLLQSFENFKDERKNDLENGGELGLISLPGNFIHVVSDALRKEAYDQAKDAAQKIIKSDPNFAGYGYYYHALARFEKGIDNVETMKKAMNELEMAIFLLNKQADSLEKQSQLVSSVNSAVQKRGIGANSDFFGKSIANTVSLLRAHISAAEKACGRAIRPSDFDTSAINGDSTKEVFDMVKAIAREKESIRKNICPQCVSERVEIRLRITTKDRTKVDFLTTASTRKGDRNKVIWTDDTLEVCGGVTDEELEQVKGLDLPSELVLYVVGDVVADTANSDDKSSLVVFPPSVAYAVPKIIENLRNIAKDGKLKGVEEKERSNVDKLFFDTLLSEKFIQNVINDISDGSAQNYLVLDANYDKKVLGKWDSDGFCCIGQGMKEWFLQAASSSKAIPESEILTEAQRLLALNQKDKADDKTVLKSIVELGVGKMQKMQPVKKEKIEIMKSHSKVIAVKLGITDDKINEVSFEGIPFLERNRDAILTKLKESKGREMKEADFDGIFTTDDQFEFVVSNSFLYLQKVLQVNGIAKILCERLGLQEIEEHLRAPLDEILEDIDETIDVEKMSKISFASELEGSLLNQRVIHMPRVRFGIDKSKGDITDLKESIKKELKEKIKGLVDRIKDEDEKADKKQESMMTDILNAVEGTITYLVNLKPCIKVEFETLADLLQDETPPELRDFMDTAVEITFKVVKKKVWSDYWDWNAFAVAMIGIAQIVAGAALTVCTFGAAVQLGGALIAEGIGDVMYATVAGLTGTFSWKEWGIQKAISLTASAVGILSGGISTLATKSVQVAALTTKAAAKVVFKAVAKQIALDLIKAGVGELVNIGVEKLSEIATAEIFKLFKDNFQHWVESDRRSKAEVEKIKVLMGEMMDKYGKKQADKYIKDAIGDSQVLAAVSELESSITQGVLGAAGALGDSLGDTADRLQRSGSAKSKTVGHIAKAISWATETAEVVNELQKCVRYVPDIYKILHGRLKGIETENNPDARDKLSGAEKEAWINNHMKETSKVIYTTIEGIVQTGITGKAFGQIVSKGTEKLYEGTIDTLGDDLNKLKTHAETVDTITTMSNQGRPLTEQEQNQIIKLQKELMEQDNHYDTVLKEVDPRQGKDMKVIYNGEEVTLGSLEAKLGTGGLRLLSNSDGASAPILIRPKYDEFINGISLDRPANLVDLHAMAKEAKLNICLEIEESGGKSRTEQVEPNKDQQGNSVHIGLLKNDQYPEGHYVLKGENGNVDLPFESIGAASAAQVIVYQKARNDGMSHENALKMANSKEDLQGFLEQVKKSALNDESDNESGTRYYYESAEYEKQGDVLGGSSPHPLPLVPEPDIEVKKKVDLKPARQKKKAADVVASQEARPKPVPRKKEFVQDSASKKPGEQKVPSEEANSKLRKHILTRVIGPLHLRNSTKVTMVAGNQQQKGGDEKIQMSKETLKTMVDNDSSSLGTASTVDEKPGLDGKATEKFKRLAKQAGVETAILTTFKLAEEQNGNAKKDNKTEVITPNDTPSREETNETKTGAEKDIAVMTISITRSITKTQVSPKWGDMEVRTLRRRNTI